MKANYFIPIPAHTTEYTETATGKNGAMQMVSKVTLKGSELQDLAKKLGIEFNPSDKSYKHDSSLSLRQSGFVDALRHKGYTRTRQ